MFSLSEIIVKLNLRMRFRGLFFFILIIFHTSLEINVLLQWRAFNYDLPVICVADYFSMLLIRKETINPFIDTLISTRRRTPCNKTKMASLNTILKADEVRRG